MSINKHKSFFGCSFLLISLRCSFFILDEKWGEIRTLSWLKPILNLGHGAVFFFLLPDSCERYWFIHDGLFLCVSCFAERISCSSCQGHCWHWSGEEGHHWCQVRMNYRRFLERLCTCLFTFISKCKCWNRLRECVCVHECVCVFPPLVMWQTNWAALCEAFSWIRQ